MIRSFLVMVCEIHDRKLTAAMIGAYESAFSGIPVDLLRDALAETATTEKYWPTPAHVMERVVWPTHSPDPLSVAGPSTFERLTLCQNRVERLEKRIENYPELEPDLAQARLELADKIGAHNAGRDLPRSGDCTGFVVSQHDRIREDR